MKQSHKMEGLNSRVGSLLLGLAIFIFALSAHSQNPSAIYGGFENYRYPPLTQQYGSNPYYDNSGNFYLPQPPNPIPNSAPKILSPRFFTPNHYPLGLPSYGYPGPGLTHPLTTPGYPMRPYGLQFFPY